MVIGIIIVIIIMYAAVWYGIISLYTPIYYYNFKNNIYLLAYGLLLYPKLFFLKNSG